MSIAYLQILRFALNFVSAVVFCTKTNDDEWWPQFTHPILFGILMIRAAWLSITAFTWVGSWTYISEIMEWDWNLPGVGWD